MRANLKSKKPIQIELEEQDSLVEWKDRTFSKKWEIIWCFLVNQSLRHRLTFGVSTMRRDIVQQSSQLVHDFLEYLKQKR